MIHPNLNGYRYSPEFQKSFCSGECYKIERTPEQTGTNIFRVAEYADKTHKWVLLDQKKVQTGILEPSFPLFSLRQKKGIDDLEVKYYLPSIDLCNYLKIPLSEKSVDMSKYDLCPDVKLWLGVGLYVENQNKYSIYFVIDDSKQLQKIADYYNLDFPLPKNHELDTNIGTFYNELMMVFAEKNDCKIDPWYLRRTIIAWVDFEFETPKNLKINQQSAKIFSLLNDKEMEKFRKNI